MSTNLSRLGALFLASLLAAACGGGGGTGGTGGTGTGGAGSGGSSGSPGSCAKGRNACSPGTDFCCADYPGRSFLAASVQSDCAVAGGTYSPTPCTTMDREGSCTLYPGTVAEKIIRYYVGYDAASMSDPATNCSALRGMYQDH